MSIQNRIFSCKANCKINQTTQQTEAIGPIAKTSTNVLDKELANAAA